MATFAGIYVFKQRLAPAALYVLPLFHNPRPPTTYNPLPRNYFMHAPPFCPLWSAAVLTWTMSWTIQIDIPVPHLGVSEFSGTSSARRKHIWGRHTGRTVAWGNFAFQSLHLHYLLTDPGPLRLTHGQFQGAAARVFKRNFRRIAG
jgi:hypothetical protein